MKNEESAVLLHHSCRNAYWMQYHQGL